MELYPAGVVFSPRLASRHVDSLLHESAIHPDVIEERGVCTITQGRELPKVFSGRQKRWIPLFSWRQRQRAPGMLFPVYRPNGETSWSFRPDEPDPENPGHKYEQPPKCNGGPGNVLDVHPSNRHLIADISVPVIFVEGIKKADAVVSALRALGIRAVVVAISGVWNFLSDGEPIPDMFDIPVEGRDTRILFDSDMLRNPSVQSAEERLAEHFIGRGAEVSIAYLPDQPDGSKMGADDFFAAGGTVEELEVLYRPFDPEDIQREKLSRNERLRLSIEYLNRVLDELPANIKRDCSKRSAWRVCVEEAERRGKLVEGGVEISISARTGGERAAMGYATFIRRLNGLIEDGLIQRKKSEKSEHADSYILRVPSRAVLKHYEEKSREGRVLHHGVSILRGPSKEVPELRWSYVSSRWEKDESGRKREVHEYNARLGKQCGEIIRYLLENGGEASITSDLMPKFASPKERVRDFKRRKLAELVGHQRAYRGAPLTLGPAIIEIEGETVRLVPDWREALELRREMGGEIEAAERQKVTHLLQRAAYRERNQHKADRAPTEEEMERHRQGVVVDEIVSLLRARPDLQWGTIEDIREAAFPNLRIRPEEIVEFMENHDLPVVYRAEAEGARPAEVLSFDAPVLSLVTPSKSEARARRKRSAEIRARQAEHSEPTLGYVELMDRWRKNKKPVPDPAPADGWRTHPLDCECAACQCTEPRYARVKGSGIPEREES